MLGTRDTAALVRATARAGAKLVLVGDDAQLPEIAAGGAFRGLAARLEAIRLEGNRRQREPWERQALVDLREGRPERTVAAYVLAGRVTVAETAEQAREQLVTDWLDARRRGGDCLMIAARRRDARDLSRRAREALVAAGEVRGPALELPSGDFAVGDQPDDVAQPARARRAERHARHGGGGRPRGRDAHHHHGRWPAAGAAARATWRPATWPTATPSPHTRRRG